MIAKVLEFLRNNLNRAMAQNSPDEVGKDLFVYVNTQKDDSVNFDPDVISMSLVRIEEEKTLRQGDPYIRKTASGNPLKVAPAIRMNLWVLFVARFPNDYAQALQQLSNIVSYFQNHRTFNQENSPNIDTDIGVPQLIMELFTPSFLEQNEIWGSLRSAYQPSVLYKVGMVVFQDEDGQPIPIVDEVAQTTTQKPSS
ncbi:MAG: hypothetical protein ACI9A2_003232 [Halioglobus sp.]|jgi:hypothetical protein